MDLVLSLRAERRRNMGKIESRIEVLRKLGNRGDGLIGFGVAFSMGRDSGPGSFRRRPWRCGLAARRDAHFRAERPLLDVLAALYCDIMGVIWGVDGRRP